MKIGDFGMARTLRSPIAEDVPYTYTVKVITLWYRPAELLLGQRSYTAAVDMWSAGCLMSEMWTRDPILQVKLC